MDDTSNWKQKRENKTLMDALNRRKWEQKKPAFKRKKET